MSSLKNHKPLPRKSDLIPDSNQTSTFTHDEPVGATLSPFTNGFTYSPAPILPLTPPSITVEPRKGSSNGIRDEGSDLSVKNATGDVTPTNLVNLLTPDITPPRVISHLRKSEGSSQNHPSMSSRADSFTTAREAQSSDDELDVVHSSSLRPCKQKLPHPLRNATTSSEAGSPSRDRTTSHVIRLERSQEFKRARENTNGTNEILIHLPEGGSQDVKRVRDNMNGTHDIHVHKRDGRSSLDVGNHRRTQSLKETANPSGSLAREPRLRERIQASKHVSVSPNFEAFGASIGWPTVEKDLDLNMNEQIQIWRMSGTSTTSTIEAVVIDSPPQKQRTLRHTEKYGSLRSQSSPLSLYYGQENNHDTPSRQRRLVHKSARITNEDRRSITSDASFSASANSLKPKTHEEIIPVVVIPQRRSSLKSSASSVHRLSRTKSINSSHRPATAPDSGIGFFDRPKKRRTLSESLSSQPKFRDGHSSLNSFEPKIPTRRSSLSASTSRNPSRSNSLTAESLRKIEAHNSKKASTLEIDQPKETKLSIPPSLPPLRVISSKSTGVLVPSVEQSKAFDQMKKNDLLRPLTPPTIPWSPFQASIQSISPGPIEISEARAVPFFAHHNDSLLLVEHAQPEARVSQGIRPLLKGFKPPAANDLQTPDMSPKLADATLIESPLRNPRPPPKPPVAAERPVPPRHLIPAHRKNRLLLPEATPSDSEVNVYDDNSCWNTIRRSLSNRRKPTLPQGPTMLETHRVRNRKAGETLDSKQNPFWRPHGFWDDVNSEISPQLTNTLEPNLTNEKGQSGEENGVYIGNSLGIPQKRVIFQAPLALIRRVSKRGRNRFTRHKTLNLSHASLVSNTSRISRSSRRGKRTVIPFLGLSSPLGLWRDLGEWVSQTRQQRELERVEARRDRLRKSIGGRILVDHTTVKSSTDPEVLNLNRKG
ncbi:hypothetical protein FQN57_004225 [Myotisia sp. PD_48]|nr:hypothetical protein FQN57_004225 [Myotisia sp. PD_48]